MLNPRCKYQIFISSTFTDLSEEREYVSWELLKMRHIPAGMESFTARNERGWKTIQRAIDDSDYYLLLLAGRYGSIDATWNQSWTHHEYDYAVSRGIPVLAFVRDWSAIAADKLDTDRSRIDVFRTSVRNSLLCSSWKQKEDLASLVSTALTAQISDDIEDGKPRPGWYRGDALPGPSTEVTDELARLSAENARLRQEMEATRKLADSSSRKVEIEKIVDYLRGQEIEPGINLYEIFLILSDNLAMGIDEFSIWHIIQYNTQIDMDRRRNFTISSQLRMANIVRVERESVGSGEHQRSENKLLLTDLGAVIALDARIKKVPIHQKLRTARRFVVERGRLREASPAEVAAAEPTEAGPSSEPPMD